MFYCHQVGNCMDKHSGDLQRVAEQVDQRALWDRLMTMAQLGALSNGGVNRQALSDEDIAARRQLIEWATPFGFAVSTDEIGNLYVRRAGTDPEALPVLTGSHMDSQPKGGKFDGIYGVLAGFEALAALHRAGVQTRRPIEVVAWTNEEGGRFQPGMMGSAVVAGRMELTKALAARDKNGVVFGEALARTIAATPAVERRRNGFAAHAYIETHIEQGPVLEKQGKTIGVVTGIQGIRWFAVEVTGREAHAGTSLMKERQDALKCAVHIVAALEKLTDDPSDIVRCTIGRFEVFPGSPNTVPGRVFFTIDFRHPDPEVFERLTAEIENTIRSTAHPCRAEVSRTLEAPPTRFRTEVVDLVRAKTEALGFSYMDIPSGGGHDAQHIHTVCPTGMIFVPCEGGISHNEIENATAEDLVAGTRVLATTLLELANT